MKNRPTGGFIDLTDDTDPAVAASIGQADRRKIEARLSPKDRQKKVKERQKAKDRLKNRVNWDLPLPLKQRIKSLAAQHQVPESQLAALLLTEGLRRLDSGELDIEAYKAPSGSPRYLDTLILDEGLRENQKTGAKGRPLAKVGASLKGVPAKNIRGVPVKR